MATPVQDHFQDSRNWAAWPVVNRKTMVSTSDEKPTGPGGLPRRDTAMSPVLWGLLATPSGITGHCPPTTGHPGAPICPRYEQNVGTHPCLQGPVTLLNNPQQRTGCHEHAEMLRRHSRRRQSTPQGAAGS